MICLLFDWKKEKNNYLEEELSSSGIKYKSFDMPDYNMLDRTKKYRLFILYYKYLKLAFRSLIQSDRDDIMICVNFTSAIGMGYMSRLMGKRRTIIALNMIAHQRPWPVEMIRRSLYRPVMRTKNFVITVNAEEYIAEYSQRFQVQKQKFFVLHDPVQPIITHNSLNGPNTYVFTGGEAKRDWDTLFKACRNLPDIKFVCIAREKYFGIKTDVPANVELLFDTDYRTFVDNMKAASAITLPLNSQSPAGLIVLLESAALYKPVIATKTPSTQNYIKDGISGFLVEQGSVEELTEKIHILWNNKDLQRSFSANLHEDLMKNHSTKAYVSRLLTIIEQSGFSELTKTKPLMNE